MQKTQNYGLNKPDVEDFYDINTQNENMEIIDEELKKTNETINNHTHPYAGSSTEGGVATNAERLSNTSAIGSTTQPVYFNANGVPVACTNTLGTSVPSNAKFTDTTYSAGTGISLSGTTVSNSGVRSIATGGTNGTISVNTNGTAANVAVKGLGSAAYTASTAYAAATHTHSYLPLTGGSLTGALTVGGKLTANGIVSIIGDLYSISTYDNTTSSSANIYMGSGHMFRRSSSSSKRYKHDITSELCDGLNPENLYDLDVVQYKYNADYLAEDDIRYMKDVIGFIAEDVFEKYPIAANYSIDEETGEVVVEDWDARYMIPALLKLIQEQKQKLDELETRVAALE